MFWTWLKELIEKMFQVDKKETEKKEFEGVLVQAKAKPTPYDIAKTQIGIKEVDGSGNNPQVIAYHSKTSLKATEDQIAWCSSFVNWCFWKAGMDADRSNSAAARSWLKRGTPVDEKDVKEGDVVIFWRGKPDGWQGHVGFVAGPIGKTTVPVLSGNQSNAVNITKYLKSSVLGYRRFPTNETKA